MDQNIVFQVPDLTQKDPAWHNSKIVYVLKCVPSDYDVTDIVDVISVLNVNCTVRYQRQGMGEAINLKTANAGNGGYYCHRG
jgi:hypothetical protein